MITVKVYKLALLFAVNGGWGEGQGIMQAPANCDDWQVENNWDGDPVVFCHGAPNAPTIEWDVYLFKVGENGEEFEFSHPDNAIHAGHLSRHGVHEVYVAPRAE